MKKVLLAFVVAGFMASCNHGGSASTGTDANGKPTEGATANSAAPGTPSATPGQPSAPAGPTTTMKFDVDSYDFGTIKQGETVEHVFKFTNTGQHDLVISEAHGSCGCTIPYYPHEPIAPGATAEMKVSFNSTGKQGPQQKQVFITANTDPQQSILKITSVVEVPADKK